MLTNVEGFRVEVEARHQDALAQRTRHVRKQGEAEACLAADDIARGGPARR
ncbi:MAG: hypothetical protein JOZ25_08570 [Actinobacteria bacterium]|nr:hypothetical protein [Actinomycetota bacterium]